MDLRKLKKLIDLVEESGISELELTEGEEKVRISRNLPQSQIMMQPTHMQHMYAAPAPLQAAPVAPVLAPVILAVSHDSYPAVFAVAGASAVLGALAIVPVRGVR